MAHFPVSKWSVCSRSFFLVNIMAKPDLPTTQGSGTSTHTLPPPWLERLRGRRVSPRGGQRYWRDGC